MNMCSLPLSYVGSNPCQDLSVSLANACEWKGPKVFLNSKCSIHPSSSMRLNIFVWNLLCAHICLVLHANTSVVFHSVNALFSAVRDTILRIYTPYLVNAAILQVSCCCFCGGVIWLVIVLKYSVHACGNFCQNLWSLVLKTTIIPPDAEHADSRFMYHRYHKYGEKGNTIIRMWSEIDLDKLISPIILLLGWKGKPVAFYCCQTPLGFMSGFHYGAQQPGKDGLMHQGHLINTNWSITKHQSIYDNIRTTFGVKKLIRVPETGYLANGAPPK